MAIITRCFYNQDFHIERDGRRVYTVKGQDYEAGFGGRPQRVAFPAGTDVQITDWLINVASGKRFYVDEIDEIPDEIHAYYLTEREQNSLNPIAQNQLIFIDNINNHDFSTHNTTINNSSQDLTTLKNSTLIGVIKLAVITALEWLLKRVLFK